MIGREKEKATLLRLQKSHQSEFVVIYGRRRIGKTFLVRETFKQKFTFSHTGLANSVKNKQLEIFYNSLCKYGYHGKKPKDWLEAFMFLEVVITSSRNKKKVVFIDEIPWIDTPKSDFLPALEHFWNDFAAARKDVLLIICGSATSWIINKVFHNRGGLHNRTTCRIALQPFTLLECDKYAKERCLALNRQQITELYMALGGVAYYWSLLQPSDSVAQSIDALFFAQDAALENEFHELYASLFKNSEPYMKIVEVLGKIRIGLTRNEISKAAKIESSGSLTTYLEELEQCGFLRHYRAIGAYKKGTIFQLIDNYSVFYFSFLYKEKPSDVHFWTNTLNTPQQNAWQGLAFERVCILHVEQIKNVLGIAGVRTDVYSWKTDATKTQDGAQVDMIIDREDGIINLCEIKFSAKQFIITKSYNEQLINNVEAFREHTIKPIHLTMITTKGIKENSYSKNIQNSIELNQLFT